jgi:apolipoprotein N-acyltransferase
VLDARLPRPTALTPYARMGDLPTGLAVALAAALVLRSRRRPPIG